MTYSAQVFRVLIASPSDVNEEREIAVRVIQEWNDLNSSERQLVLLPLRWETHSAPEFGKRPQEVINRQLVDQCDFLVGIFWTRIGSSTGKADSGTLEEIERVANDGKLVMLYFSKGLKNPDEIDLIQLEKLRNFKKKTFPNALVENYDSIVEFRDKLSRQLEIQLRTLVSDNNNGVRSDVPFADIQLEFVDTESHEPIGDNLILKAKHLNVIDFDHIPSYEPRSKSSKTNDDLTTLFLKLDKRDKNYYREEVNNIISATKKSPVLFWLKNIGSIGAKDVYVELRFSSNVPFTITRKKESISNGSMTIRLNSSDKVNIEVINDELSIANFDVGALQPKRELVPDAELFLSAELSCLINVEALVYADILSEPIVKNLR